MDIQGKCAMVVGGASGMARATAERLVERGAKLAIVDLPSSPGAEVAVALGGGTRFFACDIMDYDKAEATVNEVVAALGGLHVAVNTAGGARGGQRTVNKDGPHSLDDFRYTVELNLVATFNLNRIQAWHMSKNAPDPEADERGVIINTASIAAFEGQIGQVAYSAAKAGIAGMILTMARDLGGLGIRVNAIAPSLFETGAVARMPAEYKDVLTKDAAFPKRMGRPIEYARLACAIIENPMLNGGTIRLDAGQRFAPK